MRSTPGAPLGSTDGKKKEKPLPPKFNVNLHIHEEVSSIQEKKNDMEDIVSHVLIEGTIYAQVHSSNAKKNPPFILQCSNNENSEETKFRYNEKLVDVGGEKKVVQIPKVTLARTQVASYQSTFNKMFMPILVQTKVVRSGQKSERCMVAIQLRSNMNNKGNLKDIVLAMSVPPTVIGNTLKVIRGDGQYDTLRRVVKWTLQELPKGESLMVGAHVKVLSTLYSDELPNFPVILRCTSAEDIISSVKVDATSVRGSPATLALKKMYSCRLLHRLP
eukprot:CAMPEP_0184866472 /NCGR_PEP_ID=MMETSP0580-20130426/22496_1 /TAXON_ID=1118495 /ORGANISM="Dactyliosolen fragilissimus" /LENGTH=274 /DNA_ID=CAMNT_0027366173 /DNA_START=176 /DNA_END=1000 /DNA_ORIENTATION=+